MLRIKEYKRLKDNASQFSIHARTPDDYTYSVRRIKDDCIFSLEDFVDIPGRPTYGPIFNLVVGFPKQFNSGVWIRTIVLNTGTLEVEQLPAKCLLINEINKTDSSAKDSVLIAWDGYINKMKK